MMARDLMIIKRVRKSNEGNTNLLWRPPHFNYRVRLLGLLTRAKDISREADPTSTRERGTNQVKTICQFCGWEIRKPEWYNSYDQSYACDDCLMDQAVEREKEKAI